MRKKLSLKGLINNSVKSLTKIAGISLALMMLVSLDANSQTERLEAEDGGFSNVVTVETTISGYSGSGYVSAITPTSDWAPISMTIDVATAGYYNLEVGYANTSGVKANIALFANDAWIASSSMVYPITTGLEKITFGLIELNAGVNKIDFNVATSTIDLDYVDVTLVSDPTNTGFYEAEDATHNGVVVANQRPYSGLGHLDHDNTNTVIVTFDVNVASAGTHKLIIKHAKSGARMLSINGADGVFLDLPGVGTGNEWTTTELDVELTAGDNTIAFLPSWGGVLFDYIDIISPAAAPVVADIQDLLAVKDSLSQVDINISDAGVGTIEDLVVTVTNADGTPTAVGDFTTGFVAWASQHQVGVNAKTVVSGDYKVVIDNGSAQTIKDLKITIDDSGDLIANFDWPRMDLGNETTTFQKVYEVTPHANNIDAAIVMAEGEPKPNAWGDMSVIVRFTKGGTFDARDGGAYNADNAISYTAGTTYVITMDVDVAGSTFSVTIAEKGTAVTTELATDYAFRKTPVAELNTVYFPAVTWSYTYKDVTPYALTVEYGTSDQPAGDVVAGTLVTITAEVAAEGMKFDKWITSEGVTLADATADVTTFTMLAEAVTVTATYIEDEELSISENFESSFNVYPNPVNNGVLNIQAIGNVSNLVTITNLVGQEVFTAEFSGNSTQVSTSSFTKGMYFVTLKSGNNVSTKRVIIE